MIRSFPGKIPYLPILIYCLVLSVAALPLIPSTLSAAETQNVPLHINADHKKQVVKDSDLVTQSVQEEIVDKKEEPQAATQEPAPVLTDQKKVSPEGETAEPKTENPEKNSPETESEGLSTLTKVGIGVGAAAVIGVALALSGGSDSDDPKFPTEAGMVGQWNGSGTRFSDGQTYNGTYTFYAGGSHTYDIYVSDGAHKRGRGSWSLPIGTYSLTVNNYSGSTYKGEFLNENFATITLTTTDNRWQVVLTKL